MDRPKFLEYASAEHATAREGEYVRALIEWIEWEQNEAIKAVMHLVRSEKYTEARYQVAKSDAMGEVVAQVFKQDPPPEEKPAEDEDHPNMPLSARSKR